MISLADDNHVIIDGCNCWYCCSKSSDFLYKAVWCSARSVWDGVCLFQVCHSSCVSVLCLRLSALWCRCTFPADLHAICVSARTEVWIVRNVLRHIFPGCDSAAVATGTASYGEARSLQITRVSQPISCIHFICMSFEHENGYSVFKCSINIYDHAG